MNEALSPTDEELLSRAGLLAAAQLRLAKQIVSDGGFANPSVAPIFVAAVLQAIAINQSSLAKVA